MITTRDTTIADLLPIPVCDRVRSFKRRAHRYDLKPGYMDHTCCIVGAIINAYDQLSGTERGPESRSASMAPTYTEIPNWIISVDDRLEPMAEAFRVLAKHYDTHISTTIPIDFLNTTLADLIHPTDTTGLFTVADQQRITSAIRIEVADPEPGPFTLPEDAVCDGYDED